MGSSSSPPIQDLHAAIHHRTRDERDAQRHGWRRRDAQRRARARVRQGEGADPGDAGRGLREVPAARADDLQYNTVSFEVGDLCLALLPVNPNSDDSWEDTVKWYKATILDI